MTTDHLDNVTSCYNVNNQTLANCSFFSACLWGPEEDSLQWPGGCRRAFAAVGRLLLFLSVVLLINLGVVAYENVVAETYRTLANKAVAIVALYNMLSMVWNAPLIVALQLGLRPPAAFCGLQTFGLIALALQEVLVHNELVLLLHAHLSPSLSSRVLALDEEFGRRLLLRFNAALALFFTAVLYLAFGGRSQMRRMCLRGSTADPEWREEADPGERILLGMALMTAANYAALATRMVRHSRAKVAPQEQMQMQQLGAQQQQQQQLNNAQGGSTNSNDKNNTVFKVSLVNHRTIFVFLAILCLYVPFFAFAARKIKREQGMQGVLRLSLIHVGYFVLPVCLYGKTHLRSTLWRELKSRIGR